jgi:hypothetical protein
MNVKTLIGGAIFLGLLFGYILHTYAQVGPCTIYTIVQPDGTIKNCTVCGTIINCS